MKIGELAKATGVDIETVRYYERSGLLPPPSREANGYRRYGPSHLERLAFIRHCRALDMSLADTQCLLDFLVHPAADCHDIDALVDEQLLKVRARLASMKALERQLSKLRAKCESPKPGTKCGILRELVLAAHGEACACHGEESVPEKRQPAPAPRKRAGSSSY